MSILQLTFRPRPATGVIPRPTFLSPINVVEKDPDCINRRYKTDRTAPLLRIALLNSTPMPWRAKLLINGTQVEHLPRHKQAVEAFFAWDKACKEKREEDYWGRFDEWGDWKRKFDINSLSREVCRWISNLEMCSFDTVSLRWWPLGSIVLLYGILFGWSVNHVQDIWRTWNTNRTSIDEAWHYFGDKRSLVYIRNG